MASPISFQGVSSGLKTDALVSAIMEQEGLPVQRMKNRQALNSARAAALKSIQTNLSSLASSLLTFSSSTFSARTVTSSDTNGTYVAASASGAASGSFQVVVSQVATKGRLAGVDNGDGTFTLAKASTSDKIFTGESASFAVQGTDGTTKVVTLTEASGNNTINGLRDAINASGAGVTASVVNTGKGTTPYQLVLTAKETGTGTNSGLVKLADVTNPGGAVVNSLGIANGTVVYDAGVPMSITGGTQSATAAQDARFTLDGLELVRQSNVVTDAVSGMTFTLKKGGQATDAPTTLTVSQDKAAITTAMQDVISKYNTLYKGYKAATLTTKSADGSIQPSALTNDSTARQILAQVRTALTGVPDGMPTDATFRSTADLGIKTGTDGTLSLDTTVFQAALDKDPDAVKRVFAFSGTSTNSAVSFTDGGSKTGTGTVAFNITEYVSGGAVTGTLTYGGQDYIVTGTNGVLKGSVGTPLEDLALSVTGLGSGALTLSRGAGQKIQDLVAGLTGYSGTLFDTLSSIDSQNAGLTQQIERGQSILDRRKAALLLQFSQMESSIAQLRAAGSSLGNLG